jgi:histidine triad (HIT) family protein
MATDCLFCKIIDRVIPSTTIYEDDDIIVFNDIKPMAKVHFLIVPKQHIDSLKECDKTNQSLLGKMLLLAPKLATEQGLRGFKTLINTGREGGQEIFHIHVHVFGG